MKTAMPHGEALKSFLAGMGVNPPPNDYLDFDGAVDAAIEDWQEATGYVPFFTAAATPKVYTTRYYSPEDVEAPPNELPVLDLGAGLLEVETVKVGVDGTHAGTTLTVNTDYYLCPPNAAAKERPYTYLQFAATYGLGSVLGMMTPNSIRISGIWGYWTSIHESAYRAMLVRAASKLAPQLAVAIRDGLVRKQEGDASWQWGSEGYLSAQAAAWDREFAQQSGLGSRFHRMRMPK